jgi:3-hydroxyethyl bacteriochlorophyllide a dehydrogenase
VLVTDRNEKRLIRAEADQHINVTTTPVTDAVAAPVHAIIEATGSMSALTDALPLLKEGGTILLLGYYQTLEVPYMPLFLKEARLLTAKEWAAGDLARCRDMMADGTLNASPLLTHDLPVHDVATAYEVALNDIDCLKVVIDWTTKKNGA